MGEWPLVRKGTAIVCCRVRKRAGMDIVVGDSVSQNKGGGGKKEEFRYRNKNAECRRRESLACKRLEGGYTGEEGRV